MFNVVVIFFIGLLLKCLTGWYSVFAYEKGDKDPIYAGEIVVFNVDVGLLNSVHSFGLWLINLSKTNVGLGIG